MMTKFLIGLLFAGIFTGAHASVEYTCTKTEINTIYIPILREVVDWPDDMIRPYAKRLCLLTKEKKGLQKSISKRSDEIRTTNWRVCKEVIPGNPNPTEAECKTAYNGKVNALIDQCIALVGLGHNPHNVMLYIDPLQTEVSCLRGTNTALLPWDN
jgi:hypothetical protein